MKKYKVYLFDFDNTLFDTLESSEYVFVEAFRKIGVSFNREDILFYTRFPLQNTYRRLVKDCTDEEMQPFFDSIHEIVESEEANRTIRMFDDTFNTVLDLKMAEATLGIVTSNSEPHVKQVLKRFDLDWNIFDIIVGHQTCRDGKPCPNSLIAAIKQIKEKVSPNEIVYVGDAINDVLAAKNAGIDGILLDRRKEYKDQPYTLINSLSELLND